MFVKSFTNNLIGFKSPDIRTINTGLLINFYNHYDYKNCSQFEIAQLRMQMFYCVRK